MPVNDRYPLPDVLDLCRRHWEQTNRRVFVEYVMLAGVNDAPVQGRLLARLLGREAFKVNLIPYNPTGSDYNGSSREATAAFKAQLDQAGVPATVRLTRGRDIAAACGQLVAETSTRRPRREEAWQR
jgi:23S rRNA (adenine2503-C2)-methyltransferase